MRAKSLITSVFFNYLGAISVSLSGFIATPIVIHHLGKSAFGVWVLIATLIGYTSLADLGVGLTTMRMVAQRAHVDDKTELRSIVSTGLLLYSAIGVVIVVVGISLASTFGHVFHLHGHLDRAFEIAFTIIVAGIGLTFPSGLYTGINQGFGHFRQQNLILIAQSILTTVGTILVVLLHGGLIPLAIVSTGLMSLGFLTKAVYAARTFGIVPHPREFSRSRARELVGVSIWMFIINISGKVIWSTDSLVVGNVLGAVSVAHYAVALGPATAVRSVTDQFNSVTYSAASSMRAQSETEALRTLLFESTRAMAAILCPFIVLFLIWGRTFLSLWVGPSFASSAPTLVVLVIGMFATAIQATATQILLASDMQRIMARIAVGEAIANLACSIVLATRFGIIGVALGTTVPTAVTAFGYYLPTAANLLGVRLVTVLRPAFIPIALYASVYLLFSFVLPGLHFQSLVIFVIFTGAFISANILAGLLVDSRSRALYLGVAKSFLAPLRSGA